MTVAPGVVRIALAVALLALAGACAFGVWHVVVGGLVNGNPRAATFGAVLAAGAATVLGALWMVRRRLRHG